MIQLRFAVCGWCTRALLGLLTTVLGAGTLDAHPGGSTGHGLAVDRGGRSVAGATITLRAQQVRVTGIVTSAVDGSPLSAARVAVKGTAITTLTGTNGRYVLDAPTPNDTLVFAVIGFRAQEVPIAGRRVINAALEAAAVLLPEIVVIGYGTQQRRDVTGSVASLDAEDLPPIATSNVEQLLQGRVAGVQVTPASGRPGAGAIVRIRGVGTLNDASPLYVVDGVLLDDIGFLSPQDVASVEVLKDASASAIYGSRGANGVIIITTKRGAVDQPTRFNFKAYAGTQSVLDQIDLVNGQEYAVLANELAGNLGLAPFFADPGAIGAGTDWQDALFERAAIQNYELSISGGTDRTTYYFSGGLFRQLGVIPKSDFNRVTFRLNNDYHLTDRFLLGHNITWSKTDGDQPPGVLSQIYRADPTVAPLDAAGEFSDANVNGSSAGNPAAAVFFTRNDEETSRVVGNLFAELNLPGNLTLRSSFALEHNRREFRSFVPVFVVSPQQQNTESDLLVQLGTTNNWLWENTLTYNYAADRHRLNFLAGITRQQFYNEVLGGTRTNIPGESESLFFLNSGDAAGQTNFNFAEDWQLLSYLFRTNYAFKDRYLFTGALRVDGSSRFGAENRYGWFPSFAVGWNLAEEPFLRDVGALSALKLRVSWGKIGNDKIGAYPGIPLVTGNLNAVFGDDESLAFGATPIDLANPEVKWERTTTTNIGADAALFGGRFEATVDYYRRTTNGILIQVPLPQFVGARGQPTVNAAEVLNTGLETTVNWRDTWGPIAYELGFNGATINNEVQGLGQGREEILGGGLGNEVTFTTRTVVGEPIGCFWGFKVLGVFQTAEEIANSATRGGEQPGDLRFADIARRDEDGTLVMEPDGVIRDADDKTFIGCPIPDFVYGFNARVNWGRFDLSAAFSGQFGNELFNGKKAVRFGVENFERSFLDRWNGEGTSDREPRITTAGHNFVASDRFIESGSFLKLQTLQLGYRLPRSVTRSFGLGEARIYVNGTNVFQITDFSGYSPELTAQSVIASGIDVFSGRFPPARTITFGLDVGF